jgi:hypothetical protein
VPFTDTVTPDRPTPVGSLTVPLTVRLCANVVEKKHNSASDNAHSLVIVFRIQLKFCLQFDVKSNVKLGFFKKSV